MFISGVNDVLLGPTELKKYLHTTSEQWNNMAYRKGINRRRVPKLILESWQRSQENGVNPFGVSQMFSAKSVDYSYIELIQKYGNAFRILTKTGKEKGFDIQIFDTNGTCCNIKKLVRVLKEINKDFSENTNDIITSIVKREKIFANGSENIIGTNAVNLCLNTNEPSIILGPQHYLYDFHSYNCCASPLHDKDGKTIGVINIAVKNIHRIKDAFVLVNSLALLFEFIIMSEENIQPYNTNTFELTAILNQFSQGLIYSDQNNKVKFFNNKVQDLLKLDKKLEVKEKLEQYISILEVNGDPDKKGITINIPGRQNQIIASVRHIKNDKNKLSSKLFILEDKREKRDFSQETDGKLDHYTFSDIIGNNISLLEAKSMAERISITDFPVMIFGESGTGKEMFAQSIHFASKRSNNPFVAINCGAIPAELIESELFGYEPGSFTGALASGKQGQIEIANGGTLFLDELESMPLNMQIKLLRTLSAKKIMKIGGTKEVPVDIRIISATKKDLLKEADEERFREDLFYRICPYTITLPSLRERADDVPILLNHLIDKYCKKRGIGQIGVTKEFIEALKYYHWRGNIREFISVIEIILEMMGDEKELTLSHLPVRIKNQYTNKNLKERIISSGIIQNEKSILKMGEKLIIDIVLQETKGNINQAALRLGITRPTLYTKLREYSRLGNIKYF